MNPNSDSPRIVALVPMRHSSERVPGKNFRSMAGRPLYAHILSTLLQCPQIAEIVVDTDSDEIMDGLKRDFPQIRRIVRPLELRSGMVPMNDILLYDITQVQADFYLQTHSTNPLLKAETINKAIEAFLAQRWEYDSLFSVTRWQTRLYDAYGLAINHNPNELLRTQDLPPVFEENSCLYIFTRHLLEERCHRIGENPLLFEIDRTEAWDIDEELDFAICDFLLRRGE